MWLLDALRRRGGSNLPARYVFLIPDKVTSPRGGIMNIVRHCQIAAELGAPAVLATDTGKDPHGQEWFLHQLPVIKWSQRRRQDTCVVPDLWSKRANKVHGPCVVYMQVPNRLYNDFDHTREDLQIWTDSSLMLTLCRERYPGKEIPIVPNVVDNKAFPFIPQQERREGMIIVFPRKGSDFIDSVFAEYARRGGQYWKPKVLDKMRFDRMAKVFEQAQAFLASADVEGCALPPQESMAAGVVVVGKDANGANFCMQHGKTAMVASTPEEVAIALRELEAPSLRATLAHNAYDFIKQFFPDAAPMAFWRQILSARSRCPLPSGQGA
ncbi:MAG: glycosyltransferase [Phycisphaerae bacterium]|nr:glycosyltransferase [Phycisphaerae bacterium]